MTPKFWLFTLGFFALLPLLFALPPEFALILLNGLCIGAFGAMAVAFAPLVWAALRGRVAYRDAAQMAVCIAGFCLAYLLSVAGSAYTRSIGSPLVISTLPIVSRWIAIWSAIGAVYAPDIGLGWLHGRDRKLTAIALIFGGAVALASILAQQFEVFALNPLSWVLPVVPVGLGPR